MCAFDSVDCRFSSDVIALSMPSAVASTGSRMTHSQAQQPATGETIRDGGTWRVYEFTWLMDAILFWDRFKGRWLRGSEFHYPERSADFPKLKTAHQLAEVQRPRYAVILAAILIAAARAVFQGAAFFLLSMLHHGC